MNKFKIGDILYLKNHAIQGVLKKFVVFGKLETEEGSFFCNSTFSMYGANEYTFTKEDELCTYEDAEKLIKVYFDKQCKEALGGK